ncbi:hypothetical protein L195_g044706 [Trifolium pratense]|uniref:Uncharacterized protein n=1 Tax=Trifolium pratense TaxID=57577 RepID=A0A2K3MCU1_TRIPR|nr:hypothetical protein L195_g044706 [Trifolium pratense]
MVRVASSLGKRELNGKRKGTQESSEIERGCDIKRLCLSEMFRTQEVRTNRDVLEVDCSRLSSIVRSGRNLSNKLRELLDEELLD